MTRDQNVTYEQIERLMDENRNHIRDMFATLNINQSRMPSSGLMSRKELFQQLDGTRTGSQIKD
jgi:hypothetical protein